jgi:ribosomal-protein-serine acetyltransferase
MIGRGREQALSVPRFELGGGRSMRLVEEGDARELFDLVEANRAYLGRWMPFVARSTGHADLLAYVRESRRQLRESRGLQMVILERGRIIGIIGFHAIDWTTGSTRIGYWLDEAHQGAGTMTLAVRTLVQYAMRTWNLQRAEIHAATANERSRAIPERLGFVKQGLRPAAERIGNRLVDHVVYAIDADSWQQEAQEPPRR